MPGDLKDRLDASATKDKRSLTAEIVERLNESFEWPAIRSGLFKQMDYLEARLEKAEAEARELGEIASQRLALEATALRNAAQLAALDESKAYIEKELKHLQAIQEENKKNFELMEQVRADTIGARDELGSQLNRDLQSARQKAAKMESLLHQARSRLGKIREERDQLARFVKLIREGSQREFAGDKNVLEMSDRELLITMFYEIAGLNSELTVQKSVVEPDLGELMENLRLEIAHIEDRYLTGVTDNPSPTPALQSHPNSPQVREISKLIERRTELAMQVLIKELEKRRMLDLGSEPSSRPSASQWDELTSAPAVRMPDILAALADADVDRALAIARDAKRKGAA